MRAEAGKLSVRNSTGGNLGGKFYRGRLALRDRFGEGLSRRGRNLSHRRVLSRACHCSGVTTGVQSLTSNPIDETGPMHEAARVLRIGKPMEWAAVKLPINQPPVQVNGDAGTSRIGIIRTLTFTEQGLPPKLPLADE